MHSFTTEVTEYHRGYNFIFKDSVCFSVLCGEIAIDFVYTLSTLLAYSSKHIACLAVYT